MKKLEGDLLSEFADVLVNELGDDDRIRGDNVKLEVVEGVMDPYQCWSPASISVHNKKEARMMVDSMVMAGIIEGVSWRSEWGSRGLFVEKAGQERKLRMVTDFHLLNTHLKRPVWPFPCAENIRRSLNVEDRVFAKLDLCSGYPQIPVQASDRDLTCFFLPWGKDRYCIIPMGLSASRPGSQGLGEDHEASGQLPCWGDGCEGARDETEGVIVKMS